MRLCIALAVGGAVLLVAGVLLFAIGEALRVGSPRSGPAAVTAGLILACCGLAVGVAVVIVAAVPSNPGQRSPYRRATADPAEEWLRPFRQHSVPGARQLPGSDPNALTGGSPGGLTGSSQVGRRQPVTPELAGESQPAARAAADWQYHGYADGGWQLSNADRAAADRAAADRAVADRAAAVPYSPAEPVPYWGPDARAGGNPPADPGWYEPAGYPAEPAAGYQPPRTDGYPTDAPQAWAGGYPEATEEAWAGGYPEPAEEAWAGGHPEPAEEAWADGYPEPGPDARGVAYPEPAGEAWAAGYQPPRTDGYPTDAPQAWAGGYPEPGPDARGAAYPERADSARGVAYPEPADSVRPLAYPEPARDAYPGTARDGWADGSRAARPAPTDGYRAHQAGWTNGIEPQWQAPAGADQAAAAGRREIRPQWPGGSAGEQSPAGAEPTDAEQTGPLPVVLPGASAVPRPSATQPARGPFESAGARSAAAEPAAPGGPADDPDAMHGQAAEAKLAQIKDLYVTAEAIGEDALDRHFDQVSQRQRDLIQEYFKQTGLGKHPQ
jgi:hypothetical protein